MTVPTPIPLLQDQLYSYLGYIVNLPAAKSGTDVWLHLAGRRYLRVPLYPCIRVCTPCGTVEAVHAVWVDMDARQLGWACGACDDGLMRQAGR